MYSALLAGHSKNVLASGYPQNFQCHGRRLNRQEKLFLTGVFDIEKSSLANRSDCMLFSFILYELLLHGSKSRRFQDLDPDGLAAAVFGSLRINLSGRTQNPSTRSESCYRTLSLNSILLNQAELEHRPHPCFAPRRLECHIHI